MQPNAQQRYVDQGGKLTPSGMELLRQMAREIELLKARVAELESA